MKHLRPTNNPIPTWRNPLPSWFNPGIGRREGDKPKHKMKKLLNSALAAVLFCGLLISTTAFSGCSTANTVSYKTVTATQVTVETAMTGWGDWVAHQKSLGTPVPITQEATVKSLYLRYQAAAVVVADAGQQVAIAAGNTNAPTTTTLLNTAISVAGACLADLVAAIRSFGVSI